LSAASSVGVDDVARGTRVEPRRDAREERRGEARGAAAGADRAWHVARIVEWIALHVEKVFVTSAST